VDSEKGRGVWQIFLANRLFRETRPKAKGNNAEDTETQRRREDKRGKGEEISPNFESDSLEEVLILNESKSSSSFFSASLRLCVLCVIAFCLLPENFARPKTEGVCKAKG